MCTVICDGSCRSSGEPTLVGTLTAAALTWTAKQVTHGAWWLVSNFVINLFYITVWTAPRAYRLTVRVARWTVKAAQRGYHWYATRPVVVDSRQPVAAITDKPTAMTLADLMQKQEANAR